jgi:hypothetical protein
MKWYESRVVWGIVLILLGGLFLLQTLGLFEGIVALVWALLFGAGGLFFLFLFLSRRVFWWALIPGFTLLGLAALVALETLLPEVGGAWGGALFLGGIGLSFWAVYFVRHEHWWAIIPGGTMFTLALVAAVSPVLEGTATGGLFFLGLALTFGLLSVVRTPQGRMQWALIPAAVLGIMGLVVLAAATPLINYLWPAALVLAGLFLLLRAFGFRRDR